MKTISALDKLFPAPKDGNPGNDAVMYRIVCSDTTPNVTNGAAVITLAAVKITGSKRESYIDRQTALVVGRKKQCRQPFDTYHRQEIHTYQERGTRRGGWHYSTRHGYHLPLY